MATLIRGQHRPTKQYKPMKQAPEERRPVLVFVVGTSSGHDSVYFSTMVGLPNKDGYIVLNGLGGNMMHLKAWLWYVRRLKETGVEFRIQPQDSHPPAPDVLEVWRGNRDPQSTPYTAQMLKARFSVRYYRDHEATWSPRFLPEDQDEPISA
jgi:hypothetical protein